MKDRANGDLEVAAVSAFQRRGTSTHGPVNPAVMNSHVVAQGTEGNTTLVRC